MLAVLGHRTYGRLFAAQVLSLAGSGLTTVALGLLAYELAGADAGAVLGTALALKMSAYVGIAPIAGALAARLPRRAFLIALDLCRASLVLLLPFVDQVWQVYVLVFLFQAFSAAFTPTFQATIPEVLPDERSYMRALSLSRLAYDLESLLSPALAGLLLAALSFHWLFVGTAVGFLASATLVMLASPPDSPARQENRTFRERLTRGGWIYLATPRLRGLLALYVAVAAAGAMVIVNTVVLVKAMGGADEEVALFFAAFGFGSMLVALLLPRVLDRIPPRPAMLGGGVVLAVALGLGSLEPGYTGILALWFVLGLGSSLVQTPSGLLLKRSSHAEDRPTLFSSQFALSHACWLIAYPLAGWLGAKIGLAATFPVLAVAAAGGVGAAALLWPRHDPAVVEHEHLAMEHDHPHVHDAHHDHPHGNGGEVGPSGHRHGHRHRPVRHAHPFVVDDHHPTWPRG